MITRRVQPDHANFDCVGETLETDEYEWFTFGHSTNPKLDIEFGVSMISIKDYLHVSPNPPD